MNVDNWLLACYDRRQYNCLHFARDVWLSLTGIDIAQHLGGLLQPVAAERVRLGHFRAFKRLAGPESPCLVYMRQLHSEPHIGVYVDGRVLHLLPQGPEYRPVHVASRHFTSARYYK